ncbi:pseudouridine synthase [Shewanella sp. JM162201]|uniref:Pseudouridine synthase n=1 Tax=Shewanella jiangmenensis TaxID=2837387 RepID=A0ABS5V294_9GAMM|nr:RNA pseudouridine synthase [Shewanella jiangmenensis]MBT1443746.1 pseudouridine synthase [Shewanella jiangmenensis]
MTRLCKYLADAGVASRRGAARLIEAKRVTLDGKLATHTDPVLAHTLVCVDGNAVNPSTDKHYYAYHKPVGVDCRLLKNDPCSLLNQLPAAFAGEGIPRLYPAGRLDKDSRGLLLLTNDGELTQQLMHPDFDHEKGYLATLDKAPKAEDIAAIAAGLDYGDGPTRPCRVERMCDDDASEADVTFRVRMFITEGKKRQIRRLWRARGYKVVDLLRDSIQTLMLGELAEGEMRPLTPEEMSLLKRT